MLIIFLCLRRWMRGDHIDFMAFNMLIFCKRDIYSDSVYRFIFMRDKYVLVYYIKQYYIFIKVNLDCHSSAGFFCKVLKRIYRELWLSKSFKIVKYQMQWKLLYSWKILYIYPPIKKIIHMRLYLTREYKINN